VQFRYSLYKKIEAGQTVNIKEIGYESNYTHSSYMVRMYKKYTGLNPSAFFDKVVIEGNYVFIAL
jgi:YesN/AraC family two-component response regulator